MTEKTDDNIAMDIAATMSRATTVTKPTIVNRASTIIPEEAGSAAVTRSLTEQLRKTTEGIAAMNNALTSATESMNRLWEQIQRDRETLVDMERGRAMLEAAVREGNKPKFLR